MRTQNNIDHIFAAKHNLEPLVNKLGGQRKTINAVLNADNGRFPSSGVFKFPVNVSGQDVWVKGIIHNGMPKLGTMSQFLLFTSKAHSMKSYIQILIVVVLIFLFGLAVLIENRTFAKKESNWVTVNSSSFLHTVVSDVDLNHNDLVFNDTLHFNTGSLENNTSDIMDIWQMKTPFYVIKKAGNDTIVLRLENLDKKYLILK